MGGGVLLENWLLMFDRYIKWNVPVSIKIFNQICLFFCCVKSSNLLIYSFFCVKVKQNKVVFHVYKAVIACQT